MIDFDAATSCRICLENGAIYPIFEANENHESVHAKLAVCLRQKIEDIEGYPRNICMKCKNSIEIFYNFISTFEKTCEILQRKIKIVNVKSEVIDSYEISDDNDNGSQLYPFELQLKKEIEVEKRNPADVLSSLAHLTIKKIKVEKDSHLQNVGTKNGKTANSRNSQTIPVKKSLVKKPLNGAKSKPNSPVKPEKARSIDLQQLRLLNETRRTAAEENQAQEVPAPKLCDLCGETFLTAERLSKHKRKAHLERKFKCTKCPKDYKRQKDLDEHVTKQHENIRNAICDECGKAFFTKKHLRSHKVSVHLKDPTKKKKHTIYNCKFCERIFTYKRGVIIHERSMHTGERPSVCKVCDSSFYDSVYLAEHMRIHTGATPFKCPICGRGYTQRGNMKSHMRNHKISELDPDTLSKLKPNYFKFMRP